LRHRHFKNSKIKSQNAKLQFKIQNYKLLRGIDHAKDQSYMLAMVKPEDLEYAMFPLGEMTKTQVRSLAKKWKLPVAGKRESQEICFVGDPDYRDFLKRYIPSKIKPGKIVDHKGNLIGKHLGLPLYTVGQRKGLETSVQAYKSRSHSDRGSSTKSGRTSVQRETKPMYVVGMDVGKNLLIVGEEKDLYKKEMVVEKVNVISDEFRVSSFEFLKNISVQIRYHHKAVPCSVEICTGSTSTIKIKFKKPERAITPGQFAVFYRGDEVLGGGTIR
jgi:tRNA-specific 2-thiouridylase